MNQDYDQKLKYLLGRQNDFAATEEGCGAHDHSQERLRMQSITQSYNMYDSSTFKLVKNVKALIDTNPEHKLGDNEDYIHQATAMKYLSNEKENKEE